MGIDAVYTVHMFYLRTYGAFHFVAGWTPPLNIRLTTPAFLRARYLMRLYEDGMSNLRLLYGACDTFGCFMFQLWMMTIEYDVAVAEFCMPRFVSYVRYLTNVGF